MEAIRIRRCRLRVVRQGGWSWGAEPKLLVDRVTRELPVLLAQLLREQLADCPPDAVITHLKLRVPARLGELYSLIPGAARSMSGAAVDHPMMQRVRARLETAVREAVPEIAALAMRAGQPRDAPFAASESPTPVIDVLCRWFAEKSLRDILAADSSASIDAWIDAVLAEIETAAQRRALPLTDLAPQIARLVEARLGRTTPAGRIELLAKLVERLLTPRATAPPMTSTVEPGSAPEIPATTAEMPIHTLRALIFSVPTTKSATPVRRAPEPRRNTDPVVVDSVLPFIVTGVLARSGYLKELHAALATLDRLDQADVFAAALAYKLAPPPRRGWDRDVPTQRLAAALCATERAPDGERMAQFLRGLSAVCASLNASLWSRSRAARSRAGILVDRLDPNTWSAMDLARSQPLGWFASPEELLKFTDFMPHQSWWLASGAAELTAMLEQRGARIVTAHPPVRASQWLSVDSNWWTNDAGLRRRASQLAAAAEAARDVLIEQYQEFIERRPLLIAARPAARTSAESSITLAVSNALATITTTLWKERGEAQALLALQRLGDLGGTVIFEQNRILVRPALGRRFMDLGEHGLLRDIVGIPWLPGRRIEFAGL